MTIPPMAQGAPSVRLTSTRRKLGLSRSSLTAAIWALALSGIGATISPEPGLVFCSGLVLAFLFLLLWQENEPPILLFPALFQWLTVSLKPLTTIFSHTPVNALAEYDQDLRTGAFLALAGVAALGLGIRVGMGRPDRDWNSALRNEAALVSSGSLLKVAVGAILLGHLLFFLMRFAGPLYQLIYAMAGVRFVGLFALAYWALSNRRGYAYVFATLAIEVGIGITGFFSDFKAPIFILCFAALASRHRLKMRDGVILAVLVSMLVYLGSFWSYIKLDYRTYVSGGTNSQIIVVPLSDRIDYLTGEAKRFDGEHFSQGLDLMLSRLSYIDFLSATIQHVPEILPFENGARVGRAVIHILTPRILFPNKPSTEFDSEVTAKYTGLPLQIREGTSISIGYLGELYIDFGMVGSVIGCLIIGGAIGSAYRWVRGRGAGSVLLLYGVRSTAVLTILPFETALIKYVGGAATAFIAAYLLQRYVLPRLSRELRWNSAARPVAPRPGYAV